MFPILYYTCKSCPELKDEVLITGQDQCTVCGHYKIPPGKYLHLIQHKNLM